MEPIPLSMLNAYVYCPRRFHIEFAQHDMADNADVVSGRSDHRPVDAPETADRARQEGDVLRTRSLWLTSPRLGLCGRLDMLEQNGQGYTPVEYKRGKPPPDKPYDNDRIQLAAAALLIEEHFKVAVAAGVLYYRAERRRIEVPIDAPLRELTLKTLEDICRAANDKQSPPPLVNDPRCPRCSLVGLCLPDEIQALHTGSAAARRLIPSQTTGQVLYIAKHDARVSIRGTHLIVTDTEENRAEIPMEQVEQVVLVGYPQITTQALLACLASGIPVAYVSMSGRFLGMAQGPLGAHGMVRTAYALRFRRPAFRLKIARAIAASKVHNQRTMLLRNAEPSPQLTSDLGDMKELAIQCNSAESLASLRGMEGRAGRLYFRHWPEMIKVPGWWPPGEPLRRSRRPPHDPVNSLLGLAYTCLTTDFIRACAVVGLDPYLGVFHSSKHGRPALALDLMEPFRPLVADSTVLRLLNTRALDSGHFRQAAEACYMNEAGRKAFFAAYEQRKAQEITHPVFAYTCSYSRIFGMQARLLTRVAVNELDTYPPFEVR